MRAELCDVCLELRRVRLAQRTFSLEGSPKVGLCFEHLGWPRTTMGDSRDVAQLANRAFEVARQLQGRQPAGRTAAATRFRHQGLEQLGRSR